MNLIPLLKKQYPEGTIGGQCGDFAHRLVQFPSVGDKYSQKKQAVRDYGILRENLAAFQIGDVVITSEGTTLGIGAGHVAVVADMDKHNLFLAESNFKSKLRVSYGRVLPKNNTKIYGVIRGNILVDIPITFPITLNVSYLMQYQKQWNGKVFDEIGEWFMKASNGRIAINPFPLYTYHALKNWYYSAYGTDGNEFYNVINRQWYEDNDLPLAFTNANKPPHVVVWSINRQQWEGSVFGKPDVQEIGWYYPNSNPMQIVMCAEEKDMSPFNYGTKLFVDAVRHEISHGLYALGRPDGIDLTHTHFFNYQLEKIFDDIDYKRLIINL